MHTGTTAAIFTAQGTLGPALRARHNQHQFWLMNWLSKAALRNGRMGLGPRARHHQMRDKAAQGTLALTHKAGLCPSRARLLQRLEKPGHGMSSTMRA